MLTGHVGDDTWETPALRGGKGERVRWMPLVSTWQAGDAASSQPLAGAATERRKTAQRHQSAAQPAQSRKAVVGAGGAAGETGRVGEPGKATAHAATGWADVST